MIPKKFKINMARKTLLLKALNNKSSTAIISASTG